MSDPHDDGRTPPLQGTACPSCGAPEPPGASACGRCGRALGADWSEPFEPGRGPARRLFSIVLLVAVGAALVLACLAVVSG